MDKRPTWQEYFVNIVNAIAARGTCDRGQSGAVIVKDNDIVSTGYVGSAAGDDHCDDVGHKYEYRLKTLTLDECDVNSVIDGSRILAISQHNISQHCIRTIHAEQNAICQAAKNGHVVKGATMYCSMVPCNSCAMMIINCGIKEVIALKEYQTSEHTKALFIKCGVKLTIIDSTLNSY